MASVSINMGPASHEDRLRDYPPERWPAILRRRRYYVETRLDYDCRCLTLFLEEAEQFYADLGYSSPDEMMEQELTIRPDWVRKAVACLSQRKVDRPSSAAELGLKVEDARLDPMPEQEIGLGKPGPGRGNKTGDDITRFSERGTSQHYLLRRIARDCPELLDDIGPGKPYRSARAAAIAAGIVKDVPTVRLTEPSKVVDQVLERMGPEWAAQLAAALTERLTSAD